MVDFIKTRLNVGMVHIAYDTKTLEIIRVTEAASSKEIKLDEYDTNIANENIIDYISS